GGVEGQVPRLRDGRPGTEVAAEEDSLRGAPKAARGRHLPDGGAELDLPYARVRDRPGDGDERAARRLVTAGGPVPAVPEACDQGGRRQALDVLNQGGPSADPALERTRRRSARQCDALVQVADRRGLLSGDVAGGSLHDGQPPAQVAAAFGGCSLQRRARRTVLTADVDQGPV